VIDGADLDHVAVATERSSDVWARYIGQLGGAWRGGMPDPGFAWAQIEYANGMRLEVLEPHRPELNDFLRRFLDRNGPGPHHLTFKVPDLVDALGHAESAGYRPVSVNMEHPDWKEAFLHPRDAPGVVVQLAQSSEHEGDWEPSPAPELSVARAPHPATLERVTHAVADIDEGLRLFTGLLAGRVVDAGENETSRWVDVGWAGPGRVRLTAPTTSNNALTEWLGERAGRVHHLAFSLPGLDAACEVAPEDNLGVRLQLSPG